MKFESHSPDTCDIHKGGTFARGMGGGHFYLCGCVWDQKEGVGPKWHRGVCQDERSPEPIVARR